MAHMGMPKSDPSARLAFRLSHLPLHGSFTSLAGERKKCNITHIWVKFLNKTKRNKNVVCVLLAWSQNHKLHPTYSRQKEINQKFSNLSTLLLLTIGGYGQNLNSFVGSVLMFYFSIFFHGTQKYFLQPFEF